MLKYKILPKHHLIIIAIYEKTTVKEILHFQEKLRTDPDYSEKYNVINDVSLLKNQYSLEELESLARSEQFYSNKKIAIVAPSDVSFGVSRTWEMLMEHYNETRFHVFRDRTEALKWLKVDKEAVSNVLNAMIGG